jgi:methionyl-tRNA synthetase
MCQLNTTVITYDDVEFGKVTNYKVTENPETLFARIVEKEKLEEIEADTEKPVIKVSKKEEITIDDFAKIEMIVGEVKECAKHPKADKLLVSQIDIGGEIRQVVSGIANSYKPEEMIGKKVVVVINLKPVKLRGVESQGMIICGADKKNFEVLELSKLPIGSEVK